MVLNAFVKYCVSVCVVSSPAYSPAKIDSTDHMVMALWAPWAPWAPHYELYTPAHGESSCDDVTLAETMPVAVSPLRVTV